jgi:hypothetical protein
MAVYSNYKVIVKKIALKNENSKQRVIIIIMTGSY